MQPQVSDQPDALADKIEEQFASLCDSDCGKVLRDNIYIYNTCILFACLCITYKLTKK